MFVDVPKCKLQTIFASASELSRVDLKLSAVEDGLSFLTLACCLVYRLRMAYCTAS